jgi:hypothetical protein
VRIEIVVIAAHAPSINLSGSLHSVCPYKISANDERFCLLHREKDGPVKTAVLALVPWCTSRTAASFEIRKVVVRAWRRNTVV